MTDTVIKGSGNSRSIKAAANIPATWEAFRAQLISSGIPIDLLGLNSAGVNTHGTDLNKANLLTDATATGMGLTAAATPNDAFAKLRELITTAQSTADSANTIANGKASIATGSYNGTGSSQTITVGFYPKAVFVVMLGYKFIYDSSHSSSTAALAVRGYPAGSILSITSNGFTVNNVSTNYEGLNYSGSKYRYIAFG